MRTQRLPVVLLVAALLLGGLLGPPAPAAAQGAACFAETNQCLRGRFLAYWRENGGLARNGFPLTGERRELLEDGREYTVQYFERVRLELHPENAPPYDVLLGQFGRRIYRDPVPDPLPAIDGRFLVYWERNGGLAQFGYPLDEARITVLEDGGMYTVQYFERARFEYHPENAGTPYEVLLGQFGRRILAENDLLAGDRDFQALYITNERVQERLGAPARPATRVRGATQEFERGRMIYRGDTGRIYVLCGGPQTGEVETDSRGQLGFVDTWREGEPVGGGPGPAPGLYEPRYGFGKLWRSFARTCLGYATAAEETYYSSAVQDFGRGVLLGTPDGRAIDVLSVNQAEGRYERFPIPGR